VAKSQRLSITEMYDLVCRVAKQHLVVGVQFADELQTGTFFTPPPSKLSLNVVTFDFIPHNHLKKIKIPLNTIHSISYHECIVFETNLTFH